MGYDNKCKRLQKKGAGVMIRLKDIAQTCGVSVATVSRALNGLTDTTRGTGALICQVAREMGYFPNAAARALKTNRSYHIGVLYEDRMSHEYFSLVIDSLRKHAGEKGYDLTFVNRTGKDGSYLDHVLRRNLDGVVILQADFNSPEVIRLAGSAIPLVVVDHEYPDRDCVMNDNGESMEELVQAALNAGHRRLAFIHGEMGTVTRSRQEGFLRACKERGLAGESCRVLEGGFRDPDRCAGLIQELLKEENPPTCVFCPDDYSCLGALLLLEKQGIRVPEDVSLVGYDGIFLSEILRPRLTTYCQNAEQIGASAVELLLDAIENEQDHQPRQAIVRGQFLEGETLGPA